MTEWVITIFNIRSRLKNLNTLRNQILAVFLFVMMMVLSIVSVMVYNQVGDLMKDYAEKQIQQTAVEANGRMETLYKQIDGPGIDIDTLKNIKEEIENEGVSSFNGMGMALMLILITLFIKTINY